MSKRNLGERIKLQSYWHRCLSKRRFIRADETPIQVLKESDKRPQSKSYVWLTAFLNKESMTCEL